MAFYLTKKDNKRNKVAYLVKAINKYKTEDFLAYVLLGYAGITTNYKKAKVFKNKGDAEKKIKNILISEDYTFKPFKIFVTNKELAQLALNQSPYYI